jgi:uncharacterized membrane protein
MTGSLGNLLLASAAFVGGHFALSSAPVRGPLIRALGEWAFRGVYSTVAIAALVWLLLAYAAAPDVTVWRPPTALRHLSLTIMPVAFFLLIASLTSRNPTLAGADRLFALEAKGVLKLTRHPMMWGIGLWGIAHLLAAGEAAAMILFAAMTVLALGGAWHLDRRKARALGADWQAFAQATSFVPLAAVFAGRARLAMADLGWWRIAAALGLHLLVLYFHGRLFGAVPLAIFSG